MHTYAVSAQALAESLGVGGYQVAKTVLIDADGTTWMAVLAAPEIIDLRLLSVALGAHSARLLHESEVIPLFPDCQTGAEPPFGSLYGVPVVLDGDLAEEPRIFFRAGSHEEAISMKYRDYERLEQPLLAQFSSAVSVRATPTQPHV
jgi:Ala-tRNA(Pro) deacylase